MVAPLEILLLTNELRKAHRIDFLGVLVFTLKLPSSQHDLRINWHRGCHGLNWFKSDFFE